MNDLKEKKYAKIITIGCRLNQTDSALISNNLNQNGYTILPLNSNVTPDITVINTCSVTASASQKSRQAARSQKKQFPDTKILATGCGIETEKEFWGKEASVDLFIPNNDKSNIIKYINNDLSYEETKSATNNNTFIEDNIGYYPFKCRANLKIQEGCNSFCSYCVVPFGRGKPKSRDFDNTIKEFKELLRRGHKEIVLSGVNIATYNINGKNLVDLLKSLSSIPGDFRIRLSSTEPQFQMKGLIEVIKNNPKICRFLHLPLQHGTNKILSKMRRNYSKEEFKEFALKAKEEIPDICLGSDVIVGFPGETEELFAECQTFIDSLPLSYLHVFKYSKREGTPAANYDNQISGKISSKRHKILSQKNEEISKNFIKSQLGKKFHVLFENINKKDELNGWTDNYIKVSINPEGIKEENPENFVNHFSQVMLKDIKGYREASGIFI